MSSLMSAFVKICSIEKQYFSLSFLVSRRFLMKDTALQSGYAAILNHDLKVIVIYILSTRFTKEFKVFHTFSNL